MGTSKIFGALSIPVSSQKDEPDSSSFIQQVSSKSQMPKGVSPDSSNFTSNFISPEYKCGERKETFSFSFFLRRQRGAKVKVELPQTLQQPWLQTKITKV